MGAPQPSPLDQHPDDHPLLRKSKLQTLGTVTTYLTAVVILLFVLWIVNNIMNQYETDPSFYLPYGSWLFPLWLMFVVLNIMLMGLHAARIKWTKDEREALFRVGDYGNGAKGVIIVCIVFLVLFMFPPIIDGVNGVLSVEDSQPDVDDFKYKFSSGDPLGITYAYKVEVTTTEVCNISIRSKQMVDNDPDWEGQKLSYLMNSTIYTYDEALDRGEYYIHITSEQSPLAELAIKKRVDEDLILWFTWFPIILLIANIAWAITLFALRQQVIKKYIAREQAKMQKAFTIEEVFLIYKDGRLIAHNTRRLKADVDRDVLTGMLTAVQNFVAESFQKDEAGILDEMHYGKLRILIEEGQYANMAVVVHGEEPKDLRNKMKRILTEIHGMFGAYLADWDGDTTALLEAKKMIGETTPPAPPEAAHDVVEEVFLFHRDGRFIYHNTQRLGPDVDAELLMETVDYIKEQVGPNLNAHVSTLPHNLPYGDWNIVIEYSPDVYLAALLSGPEPKGLREQMENVLEELNLRFGSVFYQWDGQMEGLTDIRKILDSMFIKMHLRGKKRRRR